MQGRHRPASNIHHPEGRGTLNLPGGCMGPGGLHSLVDPPNSNQEARMGTVGPSGHLSLGGHELSARGLPSSSLPSLPSIHKDLLLVFVGGQDYQGT